MGHTNKDTEIVALNGRLEGLKHYFNSLLKINENPNYKSNLTEEIRRVNKEIFETQIKLDTLKNV